MKQKFKPKEKDTRLVHSFRFIGSINLAQGQVFTVDHVNRPESYPVFSIRKALVVQRVHDFFQTQSDWPLLWKYAIEASKDLYLGQFQSELYSHDAFPVRALLNSVSVLVSVLPEDVIQGVVATAKAIREKTSLHESPKAPDPEFPVVSQILHDCLPLIVDSTQRVDILLLLEALLQSRKGLTCLVCSEWEGKCFVAWQAAEGLPSQAQTREELSQSLAIHVVNCCHWCRLTGGEKLICELCHVIEYCSVECALVDFIFHRFECELMGSTGYTTEQLGLGATRVDFLAMVDTPRKVYFPCTNTSNVSKNNTLFKGDYMSVVVVVIPESRGDPAHVHPQVWQAEFRENRLKKGNARTLE